MPLAIVLVAQDGIDPQCRYRALSSKIPIFSILILSAQNYRNSVRRAEEIKWTSFRIKSRPYKLLDINAQVSQEITLAISSLRITD